MASADEGSGDLECVQTSKRRKCVRSSSKSKAQIAKEQVLKVHFDATLVNTANDCHRRHCANVVLKHLYQSLGDANGGIEACIREALIHHSPITHATTVMESFKINKDVQKFSSQFECLSDRSQTKANGHAHAMQNGSSSESHGHGVTEIYQRVLCKILTSENFSSLSKVLLENFQGIQPEQVFDFSVMNSRMKEHAYEQSPTLFLSDVQQVWRKLQDTCNEIVALAKSLSNMSRTSYCDLVGISAESTSIDENQAFFDGESESHMKPEQTEECGTYKICSCSCCGETADSTNCLVCDSCEEIYHLFCIVPTLKEIPEKSWFCADCTANGIGSPDEF